MSAYGICIYKKKKMLIKIFSYHYVLRSADSDSHRSMFCCKFFLFVAVYSVTQFTKERKKERKKTT